MSWKDGYLGLASFKGVPFRVDTSGVEFGWSTSVKEIQATDTNGTIARKLGQQNSSDSASPYPFIDEGTKGARIYSVTARFNDRTEIVGGETRVISYLEDRNNLIEAVESTGTGLLQLPLSKPVLCYAARGSIDFGNTDGGQETLSISFIEFEKSEAATVVFNEKKVADAIVTAGETSIASKLASAFDKTVAGASSLAEAVSGKMLDVLGFGEAGDSFSDFVSKATSLSDDARTIIQTPQRFAEEILDAVADLTYAFTNPIDALNAQLFIFETYRTGLQLTINGSESRRKTVENNQAVALALESACVMQAGIAALNADFDTLDDAIRVRSEFETAVKTQKERLGDIEGYDAVYNSLSTLLGSVTRYINDTASLPSSIDIEFGDENPSLVIAADYYGDAERESELVSRNAVRNPLFCKREMEVLSE